MLAEPKYKLKWADDPRNINWSKDTSKYGYKMLSKMGWSEGKGLGANESGATSHVKVSKRKENLGLGASTFHDDNWLAHHDEFSALLTKLNQKESTVLGDGDSKQTSLQNNVQSSQRKILYSKFIKSKDLSLKSKNDLACVFGQRSKSSPATPQELSDEDEGCKSDTSVASCPAMTSEKQQESFVTVKSEMNLQEYFASKMAALKQKSSTKTISQADATVKEEDVEDAQGKKPEKRKKEKRNKNKEEQDLGIMMDEKKEKKKRKKSKNETEIKEGNSSNSQAELEQNVDDFEPKRKKSKKSKKTDEGNEEENDVLMMKMKKKCPKKERIIEEKEKNVENEKLKQGNKNEEHEITNANEEEERRKSKKKKKKDKRYEEDSLGSKKEKKRNKEDDKTEGTCNIIIDNENYKPKKKKKMK